MPRGVYDRSKLKKNKTTATHSTETAVHAAPAKRGPKGKPGRKAGSTNKTSTQGAVQTKSNISGDSLMLFGEVRSNLVTLNLLADKFGSIPAIKSEVEAHVETLGRLRQQVFGTGEAEADQKETAPVASNGTSVAATQYPATVPMPSAPIPSIPTATH
jgi:hypothetical protein